MVLTLTGPLAGKTIRLNGRQFVEGRLTLEGDPRHCQMIANYYITCYEVEVDGAVKAPVLADAELRLAKAIHSVPRDEWVKDAEVEHPTVAAVALRTGNYRLTKAKIIEVLKKCPQPS